MHRAGLGDQIDAVQQWYNGYLIGNTVIYNPWSVIKFINAGKSHCRPYWVNTSSNLLVREQILGANVATQDTLKSLMANKTVTTRITDQTVFRDLHQNEETLWSLLLFSGYLTVAGKRLNNEEYLYELKVPNTEILTLFRGIIRDWMIRQIGSSKTNLLLEALVSGDDTTFGEYLSELVAATLSYYDTGGKQQERVYHSFVLGLLAHMSDRYIIRSNRESGMGRYDVMMLPKQAADRGIILEFKMAETSEQLPDALAEGLNQIETRAYRAELEAAGVTVYSEIAVAFCGKQEAVRARHFGG